MKKKIDFKNIKILRSHQENRRIHVEYLLYVDPHLQRPFLFAQTHNLTYENKLNKSLVEYPTDCLVPKAENTQ